MSNSFHDDAELWAATAATGGLTETELKAWTDHLAVCPACKKLNDENLAMGNLIKRTLDPESPDPGFEQRILCKLNQTRIGKGNRWYEYLLFHPPLAAAAAGLALMALVGLGQYVFREKPAFTSPAVVVDLDGLPSVVRGAIQKRVDRNAVVHVQRNEGVGPVSYTVTAKAPDAGETDFTVAEDGTLLSSDTTLAAVPPAVQKAINAQVGPGKIEGIEENFGDVQTTYVATIAGPDGGERDFAFNGDGTLASVEVPLPELPTPIAAAVKAQAAHGEIGGIDKTFEDGETTYTATIVARDGHQRDFTYREDGSLAAMEVTPGETPGLVKTAIEAQVGPGHLDEIDKSFDPGGITYQATIANPDGRWIEVSFTEQGKPHRHPHHHHHRWHHHHRHRHHSIPLQQNTTTPTTQIPTTKATTPNLPNNTI